MQKSEWEHLIPEGSQETFQKFEDLGPVLGEYLHLKRESGSMFKIPEQATPEDLAKARARLGAGTSVEDYAPPENLDERVSPAVSKIRELALKGGLSKEVFPEVAGAVNEAVQSLEQAQQQAHDEAMQRWVEESKGAANFEEDRAYAQEFVNNNLSEEERTFLKESGAGNMPGVLKLFARIGRQNGGQVVPADSPNPDDGLGNLGKARKIVSRLREIQDEVRGKQDSVSSFYDTHEGKRATAEIKYRNQQLRELGYPDGLRSKEFAEGSYEFDPIA